MVGRLTTTWRETIFLIEGGRWVDELIFENEDGTSASLEGVDIRVRIGSNLSTPCLFEATLSGGLRVVDADDVESTVGHRALLDKAIDEVPAGVYFADITLLRDEDPFAYARGPVEVIRPIPGAL